MMNKCFLSDEEAFFKYFSFLNNDYGCNLKAIDISNCDIVEKALCIFNTSGCFTIQTFPAHFDYNFYVSKKFSMKREELLEKKFNPFQIERDVWETRQKEFDSKHAGFFNWIKGNKRNMSLQDIMQILAEVIQVQIKKTSCFFGLKIN